MKKFLLPLILFFFAGIISAQTKVGTTAANFLTIPVGPRATGMGGAFTAIANDATAAFWNAGGLSRVSRSELTFAYTEWLVHTKFNWLGVVYKVTDDDAVSLFANQLDYGDEEVTTPSSPNGTGERWKAQDIAVGLSYARNLTDRFSIGFTLKYISQSIWKESASAWAVDIGLLFYTPLDGLNLGMNISNFGTEMKLDGEDLLQPVDIDPSHAGNNQNIAAKLQTDSWPLPLVFSVGVSYDVLKSSEQWKWTLSTDAVVPNNQNTYGNLGTELMWNNTIALRVGYNSFLKKEAEEGLTAGVGLQYDFGSFFAKIDYSYSDFGIFNQISRFSLSVGI